MQQDQQLPSGTTPIRLSAIQPEAVKVIRRLTRSGFRAYLVGGCVRDLLLDRVPKDFDIATSARPRQIKRLFRNSRIIGRRFRLVHIRFGPHILEVSTFRAPPPQADEGEDLYIRRDNVFGSEKEDAFRRDFTINGLFYDVGGGRVIDHVGGLEDLERKRVRMIGDPGVRLREDPVRILRAAKFAGRLGFEIDEELREASRAHREDLRKAATPRVLEEIYRLLTSEGARRCFELLHDMRAMEMLLPQLTPPAPLFLDALDRLEELGGGARDGVPQGLVLAVLLAPLVWENLPAGPPHVVEPAIHDLLWEPGQRLAVARRDLNLARQCLAAQSRFASPPHGRSARRFVRHETFPAALRLRRLLGPLEARAEGEEDPLVAWEALAGRAGPAEVPEGRKRRRRRRGGRRRGLRGKRREGKDGAWSPTPESSSAPAPPTPPARSPKDSSNDDSSPA